MSGSLAISDRRGVAGSGQGVAFVPHLSHLTFLALEPPLSWYCRGMFRSRPREMSGRLPWWFII